MTPDSNPEPREPYGTSPLPESLKGLDRSFPDIVYLLYHAASDRYILIDACFPARSVAEPIENRFEGLACFSRFDSAQKTAIDVQIDWGAGFQPIPAPFETARTIAKLETCHTAALVLVDAPEYPLVHFVR